MKKCFVFAIVGLLGHVIALALSGVLLRAAGFRPWSYSKTDVNSLIIHEPDSVLGWRNKRGSYIVSLPCPSGNSVQFTFLERRQRPTGFNLTRQTKEELTIVGGSFTQGLDLNDNETYPWKLQKTYPFLKVLN